MTSVEKKVTILLPKIEETIQSYLPVNSLEPMGLNRTIVLERNLDSSGSHQVTVKKPLHSWKLRDLMTSETALFNFVDKMVTQCNTNIEIISNIHEEIENFFPENSDLFINESYFIYEESEVLKHSSRLDSTLTVHLVLSITE